MNDAAPPQHPPQPPDDPFAREPVHAALEIEEGMFFWSGSGWLNPLSALALSGTLSQPFVMGLVRAGVPMWLSVTLVAIVVLAVILVVLKRWRRRRGVASWAANPDGYKSDPTFRLRLIGPGEQNLHILKQLEVDEAFEPVFRRSLSDHQFFTPKPANGKGLGTQVFDLPASLSVVLTTGVIVVTLGLVTLMKYTGFAFGPNRIPQFHEIFGAAGLAALLRGWLSPAYIRLSPGRLDILQWKFFNLGKPICRTYDLRRAKVAVILRARTARIEDPSNTERPIVSFRWYSDNVDGHDWPTLLLRAARTKYDSPPLPDEELIG